jgi:hypothetical protein
LEHPPAHGKYLKYRTLSTAISHSRQLLPTANIRMSFFTGINTLKRTFVGKVVGFIKKTFVQKVIRFILKDLRLKVVGFLQKYLRKVVRFILKRPSFKRS